MTLKIKVKFKYQHNHHHADEKVRFYKPWHIYLPDPDDTQEDKNAYQKILDQNLKNQVKK